MSGARRSLALVVGVAGAVAACDVALGLGDLKDRVEQASADGGAADTSDGAVSSSSCAPGGPGLTECGPSGRESCCASLAVPGGTFLRSYDAVKNTDSSHPATVSAFRLDRFEVTVGRFRRFAAAVVGGWTPAPGSGKHVHLRGGKGLSQLPEGTAPAFEPGWDSAWTGSLATTPGGWTTNLSCDPSYKTWTPSPAGGEKRPIACITWYEAYAFCIWDGGFLPSEAEWNAAASGGGGAGGQRVFPWSSPPTSTFVDCAHANYGGPSFPNTGCLPAGAKDVGATSPAGDGAFGQADLTGNVFEWVLDWNQNYVNPSDDFANLSTSGGRTIRGGSYTDGTSGWPVAVRNNITPTYRSNDVGVRCARTP